MVGQGIPNPLICIASPSYFKKLSCGLFPCFVKEKKSCFPVSKSCFSIGKSSFPVALYFRVQDGIDSCESFTSCRA